MSAMRCWHAGTAFKDARNRSRSALDSCVFILEPFFHFQFHFTPVVQGHPGDAGTRGAGGVDQPTNSILGLWPGTSGLGRGIAVVALAVVSLNGFHVTKYLLVI
jgi:hypothetical protein